MAVKEPQHTSSPSLLKATQALFLQHGDKCDSAENVRAVRSALHKHPSFSMFMETNASNSAKHARAGRSAPQRLSISPVLPSVLLPSSGLHLPRALKHSSSRKNGKSRGPRKNVPTVCFRLLSPCTSCHSLLLL